MQGAHSHGYLTTLRGILKAGVLAGDEELIQFVKERRQEILDKGCVYPNGDIGDFAERKKGRDSLPAAVQCYHQSVFDGYCQ